MSGRFKKAPLIYMTSRIKTTPLPELTKDQSALVQQVMLKNGLPEQVQSELRGFEMALQPQSNAAAPIPTSLIRTAYFSKDRMHCLLWDQQGFEWRTSKYTRFSEFCEKITKILHELCQVADALEYVPVQEIALSYADFIAPLSGRILADYFHSGNKILPINMLPASNDDYHNLGSVEVERIVKPNQRIYVALEQLPTRDNKPIRFLPQKMIEFDEKLTMPLKLLDAWREIPTSHYAILMTQSGQLMEASLGDLDFNASVEQIHVLTKSTFEQLINLPVCNVDWEFEQDY